MVVQTPNNGNNGMPYAEQEYDQYLVEREKQAAAAVAAAHQQAQNALQQQQAQQRVPSQQHQQQQKSPAEQRKLPPQGIVNPLFAQADFSMASHPYQEYYVAPSNPPASQHYQQGGGLGYGNDMFWLLQGGYRHGQ